MALQAEIYKNKWVTIYIYEKSISIQYFDKYETCLIDKSVADSLVNALNKFGNDPRLYEYVREFESIFQREKRKLIFNNGKFSALTK